MDGYDQSVDGQAVARRRKLLDAMMKTSSETPLVGASGPQQALLKVLAQYLGGRQETELASQDKAGRAAYGERLGMETNDYLTRMQGKPGEQMTAQQVDALMNRDQAPQLADPVAPNPREAIVRAMTSQMPEMQALGKAGMGELAKAKPAGMTPKDYLTLPGDYSAKARIAAALAGDPSLLEAAPKTHTVNGQIVEMAEGGAPRVAADLRDRHGAVGQVGVGPDQKPIIGQPNLATGEVKFAPGGGVTVNTGDNKARSANVTRADAVLKENQALVGAAAKQMETAQSIYQLAQDPQVQTGFGASFISGAQAIGAKLGWNGNEAVAKTQSLMRELASNTLAAGQDLKGPMSDKDIAFLKEVALGKVDFDAGAIKRIAGLAIGASHNTIMNATQRFNAAANLEGEETQKLATLYPMQPWKHSLPEDGAFKIDEKTNRVTYDSPLVRSPQGGAVAAQNGSVPAAAGGTGAVMSFDDYIKKMKGR